MAQRRRKVHYEPMQPVTIRLPADLIDALNQATIDDGRPSASDMARIILREYLMQHGYFANRPSSTGPNSKT